jgi:large subunit ribosomal protein L17
MRHLKKTTKFHRITGRRRSFLRNLANDLIRSGRIETTETRAKAIRPMVERLVTIAKKQDLSARRLLLSRLGNKQTTQRLYEEIAPRYKERPGGYLRISKLAKTRKRDAAPVAIIEFV